MGPNLGDALMLLRWSWLQPSFIQLHLLELTPLPGFVLAVVLQDQTGGGVMTTLHPSVSLTVAPVLPKI